MVTEQEIDFAAIQGLPSVVFPREIPLLPDKSGVYFVVDDLGTCVYLGRARSIRFRWDGFHEKKIWLRVASIVFRSSFRIYYALTDAPKKLEKAFLKKGVPVFNNCSDVSLKQKLMPWSAPDSLDADQIKKLAPLVDYSRRDCGASAACAFLRDSRAVILLQKLTK